MNQQQQPSSAQVNIDPESLETIICPCGNQYWNQVVTLKKISKIVSPTGEDQIATLPAMLCSNCNKELDTAMAEIESKKSPIMG